MTTKKTCLDCGEPIIGRADKKFCSDQCRNSYHNHANSDANNYVRNVNNTLRKNRRVLEGLMPEDKDTTKVKRDKLLGKGFNFSYYTNTYTTQKGKVYHYCYDYGYLELENDFYALVRRKEYVV